MAESSGNLYASHESNQGLHAECGCERALSKAHLVSLEKISLFRHCSFLLKSVLSKAEEPNITNLLVTKQYYVLSKL